MSKFKVGDRVKIFDLYRFAIPLKGFVCKVNSDTVEVTLEECSNNSYPVGTSVWIHPQQLTLVEPELKVGDRVRVKASREDLTNIGISPICYPTGLDSLGTVRLVYDDGDISVTLDIDGDHWAFKKEHLTKLIEGEKEMTDQEKVDKFNELRAWVRNNKERLEWRSEFNEWQSIRAGGFSAELRLKPKKEFKPLKVKEGWEVNLKHSSIQIGCQVFTNIQEFTQDLKDGLNGVAKALTYFTATRKGLWHHSDNTLSWESADQILEALEAYEKE